MLHPYPEQPEATSPYAADDSTADHDVESSVNPSDDEWGESLDQAMDSAPIPAAPDIDSFESPPRYHWDKVPGDHDDPPTKKEVEKRFALALLDDPEVIEKKKRCELRKLEVESKVNEVGAYAVGVGGRIFVMLALLALGTAGTIWLLGWAVKTTEGAGASAKEFGTGLLHLGGGILGFAVCLALVLGGIVALMKGRDGAGGRADPVEAVCKLSRSK